MIRNPSIAECEAAVTANILCDHLGARPYPYQKALGSSIYALNDYLRDIGISSELFCDRRGQRAYIFHTPTNRIVAELGVVTDAAANGLRKRLRVIIIDRRGHTPAPTIGDLSVNAARRGHSGFDKRGRRIKQTRGAYHV